MTAEGELFVDEDIRDYGQKQIDEAVKKKYGKNATWRIDATKYSAYWEKSNLPDVIEAPIKLNSRDGDKTDTVIGKITAYLKFVVAEDMEGRYVEPEIDEVKVVIK